MNSSEKFCLKWNDFSENFMSNLSQLRTDNDLQDVTLICEDGTQIEAHKVVLTAGSSFFRNTLKNRKKENLIIYMRGLKSSDLDAILDFLYHGEVKIVQDDLDSFLSLAEELQLKGLNVGEKEEKQYPEEPQISKKNIKTQSNIERDNSLAQEISHFSKDEYTTRQVNKQNQALVPENYHQKSKSIVSMTENDDLENRMAELIEWNGENWSCTSCGKIATKTADGKKNLKRHTQIHMEGLSFPCNFCGKEFRCSNNLMTHIYRSHNSVQEPKFSASSFI